MIYLDHAATTPLDPRVLDAMMPYLTYEFGNPGSLHNYGRSARKAVNEARERVARFFNCEPEQVIFTSGGSEGNNMVFHGIETELRRRRRTTVATSAVEHDSVRKASHILCIKHDFDLCVVHPGPSGSYNAEDFKSVAEDPNTGLISCMCINNETGICNDVIDIGMLCQKNGVLFHTDAVQAAGIIPLDTKEIPADMMTIASHKINGPKGVGAVFLRNPMLFAPLIAGGAEQEFGFRGGTENVPGIVGFGMACTLAEEERAKHFLYLQAQHSQLIYLLKSLAKEKGLEVRVNGEVSNISPKTLNICIPGVDAETLLLMLDANNVFVSAGSACRAHENTPSHALTAIGVSPEDARCSIRISLSHVNRPNEIDEAAHKIIDCACAIRTL